MSCQFPFPPPPDPPTAAELRHRWCPGVRAAPPLGRPAVGLASVTSHFSLWRYAPHTFWAAPVAPGAPAASVMIAKMTAQAEGSDGRGEHRQLEMPRPGVDGPSSQESRTAQLRSLSFHICKTG